MPQVPRYNLPRERTAPVPGVRVSPEPPDLGQAGQDAVFQQLRGLQQDALKIEMQERAKANETRLSEERRALNDWEYATIHDPKTGAMAKRGKHAFSVPDDLQQGFDAFVKEREKGLATDEQRAAYRELTTARRAHVMQWAAGHVRQQSEAVHAAEYDAALESSKARAATDPTQAGLELAIVRDKVAKRAQELGLGEEMTARELQTHETELHFRAISSLLAAHRSTEAEAYFAKVESRLTDEAARRLRPAIAEERLRQQSTRMAEDIYARASMSPNAIIRRNILDKAKAEGWSEAQLAERLSIHDAVAAKSPDLDEPQGRLRKAMDLVRAIKDPALQDAVKARVQHRFQEEQAADALEYDQLLESAWTSIENGKSLDAITPLILQRLKPQDRRQLEARVAQFAKRQEPATNDAVLTALHSLAHQDLAAYTPAQMMALRAQLNDEDYRKMLTRWNAAREATADDTKARKWKSIFSTEENILEAIRDGGYGGITRTDSLSDIAQDEKKSATYQRLRRQVDAAFQAWAQAHKGENPDDETQEKILDRLRLTWAKELRLKRFDFGVDWLDADEVRKLADLTDEDLTNEVVDIPQPLKEELFHLIRSDRNVVPQGMTVEQFEEKYRERLNRAFVAGVRGASDQRLKDILAGR